MSAQERYDEILMEIAGQQGGIEPLLKVFFSFLHRKTDFFVVYPKGTKNARMGFAPGAAEAMLVKNFRAFPTKPYDQMVSALAPAPAAAGAKASAPAAGKPAAGAAKAKKAAAASAAPPAAAAAAGPAPAPAPLPPAEERVALAGFAKGPPKLRHNEKGEQIPIGNGGICAHYWWTQTLYDATVYVDLPEKVGSKDVVVELTNDRLKVGLRRAPGAAAGAPPPPPIVDGALTERVNAAESTWAIESGRVVMISYEKVRKTWWKAVVDGDPEIDATAVDSTCKMDEYDGETQGAIRKIMFDQQQKMRGLPTSDEIKQEEILDKARYLPGSPFLPPEERDAGRPDLAPKGATPRLPPAPPAQGDES